MQGKTQGDQGNWELAAGGLQETGPSGLSLSGVHLSIVALLNGEPLSSGSSTDCRSSCCTDGCCQWSTCVLEPESLCSLVLAGAADAATTVLTDALSVSLSSV